jgi:hypothetical protein
MFTLIETAKLNGIDPQAWLADVLGRINSHSLAKLSELLPWNWKTQPARGRRRLSSPTAALAGWLRRYHVPPHICSASGRS